MKQFEAIIKVMEANSGYAPLGVIYQEVLEVPGVTWNTKTPFASVRSILQRKDDVFLKIRPGLWALKHYRDKLPKQLFDEIPTKENEDFNHTFYQGLLLEIGNFKQFTTYVPAQDKNQRYRGKPLTEVATTSQIYQFGSKNAVNRAKTIDVIWFNERQNLQCVFEVEHSTDMQNSLVKFVELQDYNCQYYIVAHAMRNELFSRKIDAAAFLPIRKRVQFLSYDQVSQWHAKSSELYHTENDLGF